MSEEKLQAECFQWFHNSYHWLRKLLYHVPNGGNRSATEANRLKAVGVVPGVSDMEFHYHAKTYFFEFKTETGFQSKEQKLFEQQVRDQGFDYYIIRSADEFKLIINTIIDIGGN